MSVTQFPSPSPADGYLGCFQDVAVRGEVAKNPPMQTSAWFQGKYLGTESLGSTVSVYLTLWETANEFSKATCRAPPPPGCGVGCSVSRVTLGVSGHRGGPAGGQRYAVGVIRIAGRVTMSPCRNVSVPSLMAFCASSCASCLPRRGPFLSGVFVISLLICGRSLCDLCTSPLQGR